MGCNYHAHSTGDANNFVLAAADYYFSLILKWLMIFCASLLAALSHYR